MFFIPRKIIIFFATVITLSLPLSVFAIDVTVTARVAGCNDGIIDSGIGEQCDTNDLGGNTCQSLGYQTGNLSCTTACTFNVSQCSYATGNSSNGGSRNRNNLPFPTETEVEISYTNVIFSGTAEPHSSVIILNNGKYFTSTYSNSEGIFVTTVTDFTTGNYTFTFYSLSSIKGLSDPVYYSISLQKGFTTKISNIIIKHPVVLIPEKFQLEILPQVGVPMKENPAPIPRRLADLITNNQPESNTSQVENKEGNEEIFNQLIEILSNSSSLPEPLVNSFNNFAEQHGYSTRLPENPLPPDQLFGFLHRDRVQNFISPQKISHFYFNMYVAFMTPYWSVISQILHFI